MLSSLFILAAAPKYENYEAGRKCENQSVRREREKDSERGIEMDRYVDCW